MRAEVIPLHDRERRARRTYEDHIARLSHFAELLAGPTDGPDLTQEAMTILLSHKLWLNGQLEQPKDGRSGEQRVGAFLRTTVKNRYKEFVRSSTRRRDREANVARRELRDALYYDSVAEVENATVYEALDCLKNKQADAVRLYLIGLTPNEIAEEMGIQGGTARKHLQRGFDKLASYLGIEEEDRT